METLDTDPRDYPSSGSSNHRALLDDFKGQPSLKALKSRNWFAISVVFHTIARAQPLIGGGPEARAFAGANQRRIPARPQWPVFLATARQTMSFNKQRKRQRTWQVTQTPS